MGASDWYVANTTGVVLIGEREYTITAGRTRVRGSHSLYRTHPGFFDPMVEDYPEVEDATAEPGAKRGRPRKRATAKTEG